MWWEYGSREGREYQREAGDNSPESLRYLGAKLLVPLLHSGQRFSSQGEEPLQHFLVLGQLLLRGLVKDALVLGAPVL